MARFTIIDVCDFHVKMLGKTNDLNIAYNIALQRMRDTDGKCAISIQDNETSPINDSENLCLIEFCKEDE